MATVQSLNEDILYLIRSKCSSTIDMWNFLLALHHQVANIVGLRAFWNQISLSLLMSDEKSLCSFANQVAPYCVDLRLDFLNGMLAADLRRVLSKFNSIVRFHSGNVALSKRLITYDLNILFPYLKYLHLLVSLDNLTLPSIGSLHGVDANFIDGLFESLKRIHELDHVSLIFEEKKGCLTTLTAQEYFSCITHHISNMSHRCLFISIEENGHGILQQFQFNESLKSNVSMMMHVTLRHSLLHFIFSIRPSIDLTLTLEIKDEESDRFSFETFVVPRLPANTNFVQMLDLQKLKLFHLGLFDVNDRLTAEQINEILTAQRQYSLENLTLCLNRWTTVTFTVISYDQKTQTSNSQEEHFDSLFSDCFDAETISDDDDADQHRTNDSIKDSKPQGQEYSLEFFDSNSILLFQVILKPSLLKCLTNLNLTGVHHHSIDFRFIFDSLELVQSISISPCLLIFIDQTICHCATRTRPYQIHSIKSKFLLSMNLVCSGCSMEDMCPILVEQYDRHALRHSSIHQHFSRKDRLFSYQNLISLVIPTILQTIDLLHFSLRCSKYRLQPDDLALPKTNHIETLVLDVTVPVTFHTLLMRLLINEQLTSLRRLFVSTSSDFQLTEPLIDKFRSFEVIEIISLNAHLRRPILKHLENVLTPANYPNLTHFRYWFGNVDAHHLVKHFHKTIRAIFEPVRSGFQLDFSLINQSSRINFFGRRCLLHDRTSLLHHYFHRSTSINSKQISIIYPEFLNFKPLYSEMKFNQ